MVQPAVINTTVALSLEVDVVPVFLLSFTDELLLTHASQKGLGIPASLLEGNDSELQVKARDKRVTPTVDVTTRKTGSLLGNELFCLGECWEVACRVEDRD